MKEDDLYRNSTQYRLWSFTPDSLISLRASTNSIAAERVRAAIKRAREASSKTGEVETSSHDRAGKEENEIDCLTVEEEQKLVRFYCVKAMELADFCSFPTNVKVLHIGRSQGLLLSFSASAKNNSRRRFNTSKDSISIIVQ